MLLGSNINILISIQNKSLGSIEYTLAKKEGWLKEICLDLGTLFFWGEVTNEDSRDVCVEFVYHHKPMSHRQISITSFEVNKNVFFVINHFLVEIT